MGAPGALLVAAHVIGCAFVAYMGWLVVALANSDDPTQRVDRRVFAVLACVLLVLAVAMWRCLLARRWGFAALAVALELPVGAVVLLGGLARSVKSDEWAYLLALAIGLTGLGAIVVTRPFIKAREQPPAAPRRYGAA